MNHISYVDLKRSYISDFLKLSLFPTTEIEGFVFECSSGCRTEYDTPLRWWVSLNNLLGRFIICPVCKSCYVEPLGFHRTFNEERLTFLWKVSDIKE